MHVQLLPKYSSGRRLLILLFALQLRQAARMPQARETGRLAMRLGSGISPKWLPSSKVKRECSLITCSHKSGTTGHALSQQALQHCMHQGCAVCMSSVHAIKPNYKRQLQIYLLLLRQLTDKTSVRSVMMSYNTSPFNQACEYVHLQTASIDLITLLSGPFHTGQDLQCLITVMKNGQCSCATFQRRCKWSVTVHAVAWQSCH